MHEISIDRDELVEQTLALCNIESPLGQEAGVGEYYLIQDGGVADFALVAAGTDFRYAAIEAGKAFCKGHGVQRRQYCSRESPGIRRNDLNR